MKVNIIAHRGYWNGDHRLQNSLAAIEKAFDLGYGVELDVRDFDGYLVVSHDPVSRINPYDTKPACWKFTEIIRSLDSRPNTVAVNVKSCGLASWFAAMGPKPKNWFFFDMADADEKPYLDHGLPVYRRNRDNIDAIYAGVYNDRPDLELIQTFRRQQPVVIASRELHGEPYRPLWKYLLDNYSDYGLPFGLITDHPDEAREFFR